MSVAESSRPGTPLKSPIAVAKTRQRRRVLRNQSLLVGGFIVFLLFAVAVFAPLLVPYAPNQPDYLNLLKAPSGSHWFGTDPLGRDVLSRIFMGARTSMEVSLGAVSIALIISIPVGLISGYYQGFLDDWLIMRVVDALQAFPFLILALVFAAMLGPGLGNAMIAISVGYLPIFIRTIRGQVLSEIKREYVAAARMVGARDWRIMVRHILPNITTPVIVQVTIAVASGVVAEASLSYLGLGAQPPTASWGEMLHTAQGYLTQAPWLAIIPGVSIVVAVLGFNLLGEGLQQWWNPKQD